MRILQKQQGFTIVELLIVVVIIAILAAITIISYTGIQTRANNSAADSLVNNVSKKLYAYYTLRGSYPSNTAAGALTSDLNSYNNFHGNPFNRYTKHSHECKWQNVTES